MAETIQATTTANTPYAGGAGGTAIGSLVGGLFNLIGSGINYGAQQQANIKNEELLRESWARDDSQIQRARKDAEAAGFSPLAALGNMPGNTNPTTMQAPQLDTSGISNSIEGALNRKQAYDAMRQQQALIDAQVKGAQEDTRGKELDNDLKEQTFNTKVMQEVTALNEMRKKNDISDAQYWAYLADMKARGMSNDFIDTMIAQKEAGYSAEKQTASNINADLNTQEARLSSRASRIAQEALNNVGIRWGGKNGETPLDKALEEYWSKENIDARTAATAATKAMQEALEEQGKADKEFWSREYKIKVPTYTSDGKLAWHEYTGTPKQIELMYKSLTDEFAKMYTNKTYEAQGGDTAAMWKALFTPVMQILGGLK